jgi:hypothetical protein
MFPFSKKIQGEIFKNKVHFSAPFSVHSLERIDPCKTQDCPGILRGSIHTIMTDGNDAKEVVCRCNPVEDTLESGVEISRAGRSDHLPFLKGSAI